MGYYALSPLKRALIEGLVKGIIRPSSPCWYEALSGLPLSDYERPVPTILTDASMQVKLSYTRKAC